MKKLYSIRTIILAGSLLLQLNTLCLRSRGAAGNVDLSFDPGSGVNGAVNAVAVRPDGKVIIGGDFTTVQGLARSGIARLNADGSGDATFNAGTWIDGYVSAIALQPDGKVIFTRAIPAFGYGSYPGLMNYTAVRLNSDGTVDNSFIPNTGPYQYGSGLTCVRIQPDGKVLLGGYFIEYYIDGEGFDYYYQRSLLIRLNTNGTSDTSFAYASGDFGTWIGSVTLQPDGKVLIGGSGIARLNANGGLDSIFNPGTGVNGSVRSIALQSDGKVLIGGNFTVVDGVARPRVARLYGDSITMPSLKLARSNASVIVSWSMTGLNFQLQESTNLSLSNSWSPVAQAAVTNATQISVTVPTTAGRKFFQLKSQ